MRTIRIKIKPSESGQASVLLIVILGTFLLASVGFAVDMGNMWFQRQAAQSAADASCVAGAMDMLYIHNGTITTSPGFTSGTAGDCSTSSTAAICKYAGFNGYTATTSAAGWGTSTAAGSVAVNWTFPTQVTGVTASPGITYPYINVVVREKAPTWFMGLIGISSMTVGASCTCGMPPGVGAPPLVILNPTVASALQFVGGTHIVIVGGPPASIQVNSSSTTAITCSGGDSSDNTIDTSAAGPSKTGGQLVLVGGPTLNPVCGSYTILKDPDTVLWKSGRAAAPNPYAGVPVPTQPGQPQDLVSTPVGDTSCNQLGLTSANCGRKDPTYGYITGVWVAAGVDTCPNNTTATNSRHYIGQDSGSPYTQFYGNCLEFSPGYYPTGIPVSSLAQDANDVTIFQPGVYFLNGSLTISSSNTVRNVWPGTEPSTQGVMFYFLTGGPPFAGGSGAANSLIGAVPTYYMNCTGSAVPSGMPTTLQGNVLTAQCSQAGTYVGAPSSDSYSATGFRGLMFFTASSDTYQSTLLGAGAILNFTGALYFHNSSYTDQVTWNGAGATTTYNIGNIVVDELEMSGGGTISMGLNGASAPGPPTVGIVQ